MEQRRSGLAPDAEASYEQKQQRDRSGCPGRPQPLRLCLAPQQRHSQLAFDDR
jgi:hypothetical protein